ncbi:AEC family transporter [Trueperella sp. LYQ143]|uniref:AEC family transporter n=1 Tax=unclassified Trueperella TaxID=2630174 RepID=UPI0039835357
MGDVVLSVWVLVVFMMIGFVLVKMRILNPGDDRELSKLVFYITMPAMLFRTVSVARINDVFSLGLATNIIVAITLMAGYLLIARRLFGLRDGQEILGAFASGYTNAGNIGIPFLIATVGEATAAAGIILFQVLILVPTLFVLLDRTTGRSSSRMILQLAHAFRQPPLVALLAGIAVMLAGISVPRVVWVPVNTLADATIPIMMIAMGVSLATANPPKLNRESLPLFTAICFRIVLSPILTYALAMALGVRGMTLLAAMVVSIFPTANNLFAISQQYDVNVGLVRDSVVVTALASMPALLIIAAVFHVS